MKFLQCAVCLLCISITLQGCIKPAVAIMGLFNEDNGGDLNVYRENCLEMSNQPIRTSYYQLCYLANFASNPIPKPRLWACCCDIGPRSRHAGGRNQEILFNQNFLKFKRDNGYVKRRFKRRLK